jgi:hypothetical protein
MAIEGEGVVRFTGVEHKLRLEPGAEAQPMPLYRRVAVAVDSPRMSPPTGSPAWASPC